MEKKQMFRLGQPVLYGSLGEKAVVDALTWSAVGLVLVADGRYVIASWDDVREA